MQEEKTNRSDLGIEDFRAWCDLPVTKELFRDVKERIKELNEDVYGITSVDQVAMAVMEKQGFKMALNEVLDWMPAEALKGVANEN